MEAKGEEHGDGIYPGLPLLVLKWHRSVRATINQKISELPP